MGVGCESVSHNCLMLQDGFIHLTQEAELLLGVANHFYKQVPGDFLVLAIDSKQLTSKVRHVNVSLLLLAQGFNQLCVFVHAIDSKQLISKV